MTSAKFLGFLTPSPPCQHFWPIQGDTSGVIFEVVLWSHLKLENSPRLWSSKSKMSVPTHGCCRAILYFTNPNKILPSKKERDNDWGLDDHDLRAIL